MPLPRVDGGAAACEARRVIRGGSSALWLLVTLGLGGCAEFDRLAQLDEIGRHNDGRVLRIDKEQIAATERSPALPDDPGARALWAATIAIDQLAAHVKAHGVPDAISVEPGRYNRIPKVVYIADLDERTLYVFRFVGLALGGWAVESRPLTGADVAAIDPDRRLAYEAETLQAIIDGFGRLQAVGARLIAALPPSAPLGATHSYRLLLLPASEAAAQLFGGSANADEQVVAWLDSAAPSADRLRVGDRVSAVNGIPINVADATEHKWEGTQHLLISRGGETLAVDVDPVTRARDVALVVVADPQPNAFAMPGVVGITTGLLALFPADDDVLAAVVGHELAHVALGHTQGGVTAGGVLKGIVGIGVLLPVNIVLPGSGEMLGGLMQGVEDRFNRDQERDADRVGIAYVRAAGYDPRAALRLFDTVQAQAPVGSLDQFLDIHPPYPERRALIEAELQSPTDRP